MNKGEGFLLVLTISVAKGEIGENAPLTFFNYNIIVCLFILNFTNNTSNKQKVKNDF